MSSSPRTPALSTVSSIPAVWYLRQNAFSFGKNPICRLNMGDIQRGNKDLNYKQGSNNHKIKPHKVKCIIINLTCWYLSTVNILVSLILYSAHSGSASWPEIEVVEGGCFMYSLQNSKQKYQLQEFEKTETQTLRLIIHLEYSL